METLDYQTTINLPATESVQDILFSPDGEYLSVVTGTEGVHWKHSEEQKHHYSLWDSYIYVVPVSPTAKNVTINAESYQMDIVGRAWIS